MESQQGQEHLHDGIPGALLGGTSRKQYLQGSRRDFLDEPCKEFLENFREKLPEEISGRIREIIAEK